MSEILNIDLDKVEEVKEDSRDILKRDVEAILLLSGDDLDITDLVKFFKRSQSTVREVLFEIRDDYKNRGINLYLDGNRAYFATNSKSGEVIFNFFNQESKPKKLSNAAMETLSIVAYKNPITKSEIEEIWGVAVDGIVHSLEQKKLIAVVGKKEAIGRPNLYSVTDNFLAYMGITHLEELPNYKEVREEVDGEDENQQVSV